MKVGVESINMGSIETCIRVSTDEDFILVR